MKSDVFLELISEAGKTVFDIPLRSHFTAIIGNSGDKKSYFIGISGNYLVSDDVKVGMQSSLPIVTAVTSLPVSADSLFDEKYPKSVLVLDEEVVKAYETEISTCKHFIVFISRSAYLHEFCDVRNTYTLVCNNSESIVVAHYPSFNTALSGVYDYYLTESIEGCSEYKFVNNVLPELKPIKGCKGRDNISTVIRKMHLPAGNRILVIMDLSAGLGAVEKINKQCEESCIAVSFVDYTSFEALLCRSKLVNSLSTECSLDFNNFKTLEKYYEAIIYELTKNTILESSHDGFSDCFIRECKECCELSQPSLLLKTLFSVEGIPLLKWYWNTYHTDWYPLQDLIINNLKKFYNPKGF